MNDTIQSTTLVAHIRHKLIWGLSKLIDQGRWRCVSDQPIILFHHQAKFLRHMSRKGSPTLKYYGRKKYPYSRYWSIKIHWMLHTFKWNTFLRVHKLTTFAAQRKYVTGKLADRNHSFPSCFWAFMGESLLRWGLSNSFKIVGAEEA